MLIAGLGAAAWFLRAQPQVSPGAGAHPVSPPAASQVAALGPSRRSVVLVTLDTTRPDRLEPYGATNVETPVLQRLAERGAVFEHAWAVAPITLVAHTTVLTGRYPFEHGVRNNGTQYVADSAHTLAERFREHGYDTAAFVSAAVLEKRYGLAQGFDVYDDDLSDRRNTSPRMVADRPAELTVAAARAWLDARSADTPYFLWVHLYDPHASYSPPPPYRDRYRGRLYDGEIAYMDAQLGELLAHPRIAEGSSTQPVVSVLADHGESLGEHGEGTHALLAYDATLHIPWILHVPGGPAGVRIEQSVGQVDVAPTLMALTGIALGDEEERFEGRNLAPLMAGGERRSAHPYYSETFLPYYTYGWAKLRVLHQGRWKYIDAPAPELYDLTRDPRELTNLQRIEDGTGHDMSRNLEEWLGRFDADFESALALEQDDLAKLWSLGYVAVGSGTGRSEGDLPNPMEMVQQHVGLERARSLMGDRLYEQATQQLETVLRGDPNNLAALLDLVTTHEGRGDLVQAIAVAERALALDPQYVQTYLTLSRLEGERENLERALELVELAERYDANNPLLSLQKAMLLQRVGGTEEMTALLVQALARDPEQPRINAAYAQMVEVREGKLEEAERRLRASAKRDPFATQTWLFLGGLLERRNAPLEAEAAYQSGLRARPDDAALHGALGHLLARLGQHAQAEVQLREAIRLSAVPRSELRVSLGGVLAEMGRVPEARAEYARVRAADPTHPGALNNEAIALYRSGEAAKAKAMLAGVVAQFPNLADAHNNLAAIAVEEQRWADGVEHSKRTLELDATLVEAWNNLAIAQEEQGRTRDALKAYEKALSLDPEYWPAHFNRALLLKKTGSERDSVREFNEVLARVPTHPDSHIELGELYAGPLSDAERAKKHWNAALRSNPGHPRAAEIRRRLATL